MHQPFRTAAKAALVAAVAILGVASFVLQAEARIRHHRHDRERPALVQQTGGLIPGTYPAGYGTPGYGCRTSVFAGNVGGCGFGWAYEGGPGWGYY